MTDTARVVGPAVRPSHSTKPSWGPSGPELARSELVVGARICSATSSCPRAVALGRGVRRWTVTLLPFRGLLRG
jgi:hypothetical protein